MSEIRIILEDGREFIDMPDSSDNPCLNCGSCCSHFRVSFYHGEMDLNIGGFVPSNMVSKVNEHFVCMSGTENGGRCVAMTGKIGQNIGCSIYKNRPSTCREFEVWDKNGVPNPKCQELRIKNGIKKLKNL